MALVYAWCVMLDELGFCLNKVLGRKLRRAGKLRRSFFLRVVKKFHPLLRV